jgi:hypothetical protein
MALALLDGTSGHVDLGITIPSGTSVGTTNISYKCTVGAIRGRIRRNSFTNRKTFCTSVGWEDEAPGNKQVFLHADKFMSKGSPISDPMAMFGNDTAMALTFTAETGCSLTGTFHAEEEQFGADAGLVNMPGGMDLRSAGAVMSTWVTA